jgi:precorrin-6B methylase 2
MDLRDLFNRITVRPDDVFVDYGSGMGRVICVAATYPFRAVWGVEISRDLCQIAERNIQLAQSKFRCGRVEIVHADALEFPVPREASMIFFFNPFGGSVLSGVMERIGESFNRLRREIRIIFCGTVSTGRFREEALRHRWLSLESEIVLSTGVVALCYITHS